LAGLPEETGARADDGIRTTINRKTMTKRNLRERLFGSQEIRDAGAAALKKEKTLAKINEPDPADATRARRTIGLTEQRLRAANQQSWITSSKGWSNLFGRFTRSSRR
jgi:hypothetical protein